MTRFLALLGLHFLVSFALLPDNAVVSHPVHHDDYTNLAQGLGAGLALTVRPVSTLAIAAVADLGPKLAYTAQHLLVVLCVWLALRFTELYVRDGRPLPPLGYAAAGIAAFAFPAMVDYTKYFGLLTNLTSAAFALAAMCVFAGVRLRPERAGPRIAAGFALAALSFWAKEDFALPLLGTAFGIAVTGGRLRWLGITAALGALFAAAVAFNRLHGSDFVRGSRQPDHPYYVDLAPSSLWKTFAAMFVDPQPPYTWALLGLAAGVTALAVAAGRADAGTKLRLALLPAIGLSVLAPYTIFPNHAYAYYAFLPTAMLAAALAAAAYALTERRP